MQSSDFHISPDERRFIIRALLTFDRTVTVVPIQPVSTLRGVEIPPVEIGHSIQRSLRRLRLFSPLNSGTLPLRTAEDAFPVAAMSIDVPVEAAIATAHALGWGYILHCHNARPTVITVQTPEWIHLIADPFDYTDFGVELKESFFDVLGRIITTPASDVRADDWPLWPFGNAS